MVAQNDSYASLVASTIAIKLLIFFLIIKKGEIWLEEPAVDPEVNNNLDPAIVIYDISVIHRSSAMKCN